MSTRHSMNLLEYIEIVNGNSRRGDSYNNKKEVSLKNIGIVSEKYTLPINFNTVEELNYFLNTHDEVKNSMYYISLNGIEITKEELSKFTQPIFIPSNQTNNYDISIYELPNIVVGSRNINFDAYLKTLGRQEDKVETFFLEYIDSSTINNLQAHSNDFIHLIVNVHDINTLMYLEELIRDVPFCEKITINFMDDFFKKSENRRILYDQTIRDTLARIPHTKYEVFYKGRKMKYINDIIDTQEIIEFIKSKIPSDANLLDKITFVTEFLSRYISYDYFRLKIDHLLDTLKVKHHNNDDSYSDILKSGLGVCRHYAAVAELLLSELGVTCETISMGSENNFFKDRHAFNLITIDDNKYYLDITWISEQIRTGVITNCVESIYFMASKTRFKHDKYLYNDAPSGIDIDLKEAYQSLKKVMEWTSSFKITKTGALDLINKRKLEKKMLEAMKGIGGS